MKHSEGGGAAEECRAEEEEEEGRDDNRKHEVRHTGGKHTAWRANTGVISQNENEPSGVNVATAVTPSRGAHPTPEKLMAS